MRQKFFPIEQEGIRFHCPLTLAKRHNLALQQINKRHLQHREVSLPHILHVGVTSVCNLRCPACPSGTKTLGRPSGHLEFEVYKRTLGRLRDSLLFMLFWDWGEPLLHPRISDMLTEAKRSKIKTVISTHGSLQFKQETIERLVA